MLKYTLFMQKVKKYHFVRSHISSKVSKPEDIKYKCCKVNQS